MKKGTPGFMNPGVPLIHTNGIRTRAGPTLASDWPPSPGSIDPGDEDVVHVILIQEWVVELRFVADLFRQMVANPTRNTNAATANTVRRPR